MRIPEVTPLELAEELAGSNPPKLLDIREGEELEISRLDPLVHLPVRELPSRLHELDPQEKWVVVCRSGSRSGHVTAFLLEQGFLDVRNLAGGLNRWVDEVDRTGRKY